MLYEVVTGRLPTTPFTPITHVAPEVPPIVDSILAASFSQQPEARFASPMELRDALAAALAGGASNVAPPAAPAPAGAPRQAAVQQAVEPPSAPPPRSSLGRSFNVAAAAGGAIDEAQERWLIQKDKLDFGPFSLAQIRAQISRGEILADHLIVDSDTGARQKVKDFPPLGEFAKTSERHREQNRRAVAEQQLESVDKKKRAVTFFFSSIFFLVAAGGGVVYFVWTRKADDGTKLASRSEDAEVDAFLKDVKLTFQKAHVGQARQRRPPRQRNSKDDAEFNNDANFGDASKYSASGDETLDDGVIEETMMHHYRALVPCLMAERKHNPGAARR